MNILVIGGGGREHTLVWKLAQSPKATQIYAAPGNAGTTRLAQNLDIKATDIEALAQAAKDERVDLVIVGPEAPLAEGIVDRFQNIGIPIFGSTKAATEIESSKVFAKELMQKHHIPCAQSVAFSDYSQAQEYLKGQKPPIVVKADGLAAGKGVIVAETMAEAMDALTKIMKDRAFGAAGDRVIIEEFLSGEEMSCFAFTDGKTITPSVSACDYKPVSDRDQGPNTGGMGSYSPPHFLTPQLEEAVQKTIMEPTVAAMADEGRPYKSILYGGLMVTEGGTKALEFNARFGDPETQVILPRLKTDLVDIIMAVIDGTLDKINIDWSDDACVGVVLASGGYPGSYRTGFPITGLDDVDEDIAVFHAGTKLESGQVVTGGGRVLTVVATGATIADAREKVYNNIPRIRFRGCHYRTDIAEIKSRAK